jgi:tetratricopeptide (TPR) repeat protein
MTKVIGEYLTSLVLPVRLSNHYTERGVQSLADTGFLIGAGWIIVWIVAAWRSRWALFAGLWFLIALAPVLQLVPHPTLRADRYLYVSALGVFVLIAQLLNKNRRLTVLVGPVSVICLIGLTFVRIPDWHDPKTLWSDCVRKNPRSAIGYFSLAGCAVMEKDWPTAEQYLRRTVELKPDFAEAHERLGAVYMMESKKSEAREHLERALALKPGLTEARHNLMLLDQRRE